MFPRVKISRTVWRRFSTRNTLDEFPGTVKVTPTAPVKAERAFGALSNGVIYAVSSQPTSTAVIKVGILGGSSAESAEQKGAAHLLATSAFDGNMNKNGVLVMREFENIGARVEATSDREKITYTVRVPSEHLTVALELIASNVKSPLHRNYLVDSAKERAEIAYKNLAHCNKTRLNELIHDASFGENTPLGSSIYAADLDDLSPESVIAFRNTNFNADNVVVSVHGATADIRPLLETQFGSGLPAGEKAKYTSPFVGGEIRVRENTGGSTILGLAFGAPIGKAGKANEILRGLLRFRLATRESHIQHHYHNTVHSESEHVKSQWISTFYNSYSASGLWGATFKGDVSFAVNGLENFVKELKSVAGGNVKDSDIASVVHRLQLDAQLSGEGQLAGNHVYRALITGRPDEHVYSGVSVADVQAAASAALKSTPGYAVLGATYNVPTLNTVAKWLA